MHYNSDGTNPLSIRFDRDVLDRLRRRAAGILGATPSALIQQLVDEGLRMAEHPGMVFKDGPGGRRPALNVDPDSWELIKFLREIDERGEPAIEAAGSPFPTRAVRNGLAYYTTFPDEIDAGIAVVAHGSLAAAHGRRLVAENVKDVQPWSSMRASAVNPSLACFIRATDDSRELVKTRVRCSTHCAAGPSSPPSTPARLVAELTALYARAYRVSGCAFRREAPQHRLPHCARHAHRLRFKYTLSATRTSE
jgi:hypothetical protein